MSSEVQLVVDIWDAVRDHLPAIKREDVAHGILTAVAEYGFDSKDLATITDEDRDLAAAYENVYDIHEDEPEEE